MNEYEEKGRQRKKIDKKLKDSLTCS